MNKYSSGRRAALMFTLIAVMLLTAAGCSGGADIIGPWHSTELNEVVRFHDDGTAVIRTAEGDFEAKYIYDSKSAQGVITLNGTAINFMPEGDSLILTMGGTQSSFTNNAYYIINGRG